MFKLLKDPKHTLTKNILVSKIKGTAIEMYFMLILLSKSERKVVFNNEIRWCDTTRKERTS